MTTVCFVCEEKVPAEKTTVETIYDNPHSDDGREIHLCDDTCHLQDENHDFSYWYCEACDRYIYQSWFKHNDDDDLICCACYQADRLANGQPVDDFRPAFENNPDDLRDFFTTVITPRLEAAAKNGYTHLDYPLLTYKYTNDAITSSDFPKEGYHHMPDSICGLYRIHEISKSRCEYGKEFKSGHAWPNAVARWFIAQFEAEDDGIYAWGSSVSDDAKKIYDRSKSAKIQQILDTVLDHWKTFDSTLRARLEVTHSKGTRFEGGTYAWTTSYNLHISWGSAASSDELVAEHQINKYRKKLRDAESRLEQQKRHKTDPFDPFEEHINACTMCGCEDCRVCPRCIQMVKK